MRLRQRRRSLSLATRIQDKVDGQGVGAPSAGTRKARELARLRAGRLATQRSSMYARPTAGC